MNARRTRQVLLSPAAPNAERSDRAPELEVIHSLIVADADLLRITRAGSGIVSQSRRDIRADTTAGDDRDVEATIVPLKAVASRPSPGPVVWLDGERLLVEHLVLVDPALAAIVAQRPESERVSVVERALRIGLLAIADAGVSVNVDAVRAEFGRLVSETERANERAAKAVEDALRANFADGDGRLPRTLERFLGDRGELRRFVGELFDETKRDSAIGRMRQLLGAYFDGDASRLAQLLDPTRLGSPLHQFREEVSASFTALHDRLTAIEAASKARAAERSKSAAKGADFEDVLEELLGDIARGAGDDLERTGGEAGDVIRSRKGDFVLTIDPGVARGADLRLVIEAKDRSLSPRAIRDELRAARTNRGAVVGVAVFSPEHAPAGVAPFDLRGDDVWCVVDPSEPERSTLEAAVRLARLLALATLRERDVEIDAEAVARAIIGVREELDRVRNLKTTLGSIRRSAQDVADGLDRLREGILARVAEAEAELRAGDATPSDQAVGR
jgi:hypothetical protein